jgi:hypothetical protein
MRNRDVLLKILRHAGKLLADFAYGIDAGSAIRHGLPVPPRRTSVRRPRCRDAADLGGSGEAS